MDRLNVEQRHLLEALHLDPKQFVLASKTIDNLKLIKRDTMQELNVRY